MTQPATSQITKYVSAGAILCEQGQYMEALQALNKAVQEEPNNAFAYLYRALAFMMLGHMKGMGEDLDHAQRLDPTNPEVHYRIGTIMRRVNNYMIAIKAMTCAVDFGPHLEMAWILLGDSYYRFGSHDIARNVYAEAAKKFPNNAAIKLELAWLLPAIPASSEEIDASRAHFMNSLDRLLQENFTLKAPENEIIYFPFYHSYQGRSDRELLEKLAAFFYKACPSLAYTASHVSRPLVAKKKIRIGFVLCFRFSVILTNFFLGLLEGLSGNGDFDVTLVISDVAPQDPQIRAISGKVSRVMVLPKSLEESRKVIAQEQFDMLAYIEIGMSSHLYFLAMAKLAPMQCNLGTHPMTSGMKTMDYYLSFKVYEPENAQDNYTEKLVLFERNLAVFHRHPPVGKVPREALGLPVDANLYCCPVMLFKIHPDMDRIFTRILERDPKARIVLFDSQYPTLFRVSLEKRFALQMTPEQSSRVLFLPHAGKERFIQILHEVDAILDSVHFSFGTTAFILLSADLPFVTWPGPFIRGRGAYGLYHQMGVEDLVAKTHDEYVELALRLASDKAFHSEMIEKIGKKSDTIFEQHNMLIPFAEKLKELYANHVPS